MRRLIPLLAVPALALGFIFAPFGTQEAKADIWIDVYCRVALVRLIQAEEAGDFVTYDQIADQYERIC
jgi:hypothetical protein